jgi:hypothetical protein
MWQCKETINVSSIDANVNSFIERLTLLLLLS